MGSIESISSTFFDQSLSRALAPVQPAHQQPQQTQNPTPPPPPGAVVASTQLRSGAESRAGLIYQQSLTDDGVNARNRQAIRAYRSTEEAEEREQVSRLLGVDEYA